MRKNEHKSDSFTVNTIAILLIAQFIISFMRGCGLLQDWPMTALLLPIWIIIGILILYASLIITGIVILIYRKTKSKNI